MDETPDFVTPCDAHPTALVRMIRDFRQTVLNGYPAGTGVAMNRRYECAECDAPLAVTKPVAPPARSVDALEVDRG